MTSEPSILAAPAAPATTPARPDTAGDTMPLWSWVMPLLAWAALVYAGMTTAGGILHLLMGIALLGTVVAAVHHAEVIAHRVGEPFGSLVLALAVTTIEVSLIVSVMLSDTSPDGSTLARDTVFATVVLACNGILGICLVVAGWKFHEPVVSLRAASSFLAVLTVLTTSALVLPGFTQSAAGPVYTTAQLIFVAAASIALYIVFLFVQTVRHQSDFLAADALDDTDAVSSEIPSNKATALSAVVMLVALSAVVLIAKKLSPVLETAMQAADIAEPAAVVGVIVAATVLLPECLSALRSARRNRLQTSINLAFGSALASTALTLPAVAGVAIATQKPMILGLSATNEIFLALTIVVATMTLGAGRATILQGAVHLMILALYLFLVVVP